MDCDILAVERGPSCYKTSHLPNFKVIHDRFIKEESSYIYYKKLSDTSVSSGYCSREVTSVFLHRSEFETKKSHVHPHQN